MPIARLTKLFTIDLFEKVVLKQINEHLRCFSLVLRLYLNLMSQGN